MSDNKIDAEKYGARVQSLYNATQEGSSHITNIPYLLKQVIENKMWLRFIHPADGQVYENVSLADFITSPPLKGLGTEPGIIISILQTKARAKDDQDSQIARETLDSFSQELGKQGISIVSEGNHDNIMVSPVFKQGDSTVYALRRLKRERSDLHKQVVDGQMSAHAAMIEAGFRKKRFSVPENDIQSAAKTIKSKLSPEEVNLLIEELSKNES